MYFVLKFLEIYSFDNKRMDHFAGKGIRSMAKCKEYIFGMVKNTINISILHNYIQGTDLKNV